MLNNITVKIAVGVGCVFSILHPDTVKAIKLKLTNTIVKVSNEIYALYKGETFEESQKVDTLFDTGLFPQYNINDCKVGSEAKEYDVTITRFGCVKIAAMSQQEAIEKANALPTDCITWNEEWEATDATEL